MEPFTMYTNWEGWGKNALNNTWPDKFDPPPDLPPSTVYLTYPAYYIIPYHYPNPVSGKPFLPDPAQAGAYAAPPGTKLLAQGLNSAGGGADMTIFDTASGGAVFSAGSITWPASILIDDAVSQITANVLRRFQE